MHDSDIYFDLSQNDLDPDIVTTKLLKNVDQWLQHESIFPNEVQKKMMASHIKAMVLRAKTKELLPEVDISLFEEISKESITLAERVVKTLCDLPIEEAYLLSVHFEVAKSNSTL